MNAPHSENWLKVLEFLLLVLVARLSSDNQLAPFLVRLLFQLLELWTHYNPPML
jgi:hypothetical protein